MRITTDEIVRAKPSFTMEIPYTRIERKYLIFKKEFREVKVLNFEMSFLIAISRILTLVVKLPAELVGSTQHDVALNVLVKHKSDLIEIIAISLQNNREKVDPKLTKFIDDNFNSAQLLEAFNYTMICLGLENLIMGIMVFKPSIRQSIADAKAREPEIRELTRARY